MKIDLIRHAVSADNENEVFAGSADSPLSVDGERGASELAPTLASRFHARIFSSPLLRARRTAELLFPEQTILTDTRLRERSLGQWQGRAKHEMRTQYPHAFLPSGKIHPLFTPPDGEDVPSVAARLLDFLDEQLLPETQEIIVVTHNGVMKTFRTLVEDIPVQDIFAKAEPNLHILSYDISRAMLTTMHEKRRALMDVIRG